MVLVAVAVTAFAVAFAWTAPDVDGLAGAAPSRTAYMRLRAVERGMDAAALPVPAWVPLDAHAPLLVCAVVKAEDGAFFEHDGFDRAQLSRAVERAVLEGAAKMGASTITQQLARNLYLGPQATLWRKAREAQITRRLESALDKRRLLELYLNVVESGPGPGDWGVAAAARRLFAQSAADVDAYEAAFIAAQLPAPRTALVGDNLARAQRTGARVLQQLYFSGLVDDEEYRQARTRLGGPAATAAAERSAETAFVRRQDIAPLPLTRAIDEGCGRDRELREAAARRQRAAR